MKKPTTTLVFKSGAIVSLKGGVKITYSGTEISRVEWVGCSPRPMFVNVDELAAVLDGEAI